MNQFYTLEEAASKLKVSPIIVRQMARMRQIAEFGESPNFKYRKDQIDHLHTYFTVIPLVSKDNLPEYFANKRRGLYIGSFDPPTNGHCWVIENGAKLFDELVIGIGINPKKTYTFSVDERKEMLERIVEPMHNVSVKIMGTKLSAQFAEEMKCSFILQGIRNLEDYEYQKTNRHLNGSVDTVFVIPPHYLTEISSSLVKGLS